MWQGFVIGGEFLVVNQDVVFEPVHDCFVDFEDDGQSFTLFEGGKLLAKIVVDCDEGGVQLFVVGCLGVLGP